MAENASLFCPTPAVQFPARKSGVYRNPKMVLPGLGPGIHVLAPRKVPAQEVVDGRAKPGQDDYLGVCEDTNGQPLLPNRTDVAEPGRDGGGRRSTSTAF